MDVWSSSWALGLLCRWVGHDPSHRSHALVHHHFRPPAVPGQARAKTHLLRLLRKDGLGLHLMPYQAAGITATAFGGQRRSLSQRFQCCAGRVAIEDGIDPLQDVARYFQQIALVLDGDKRAAGSIVHPHLQRLDQ